VIEDAESEVFHQLLRFILLPASLNGSDGDRRIWEKTKKKIQLTMLESNPIKGAAMTIYLTRISLIKFTLLHP
jgi:hypothetical protein